MDGERLTDEETALVLRRAAELDQQPPGRPDGLDPATVEEAAVEVGLSRESVRRALAELRLGTLSPDAGRSRRAARFLGPGTVALSRAVPAPADDVEAGVEEFLERQLFRVVRHVGTRSLWAPREDLKASVQRSIDRKIQRRLVLGDVCRISLAVVPEPGAAERSLVHLELDVRDVRRASAGMVVTGSVVGAAALGGSLIVAGLDPLTVAAVPAGVAAAVAGHRIGSSHYRSRVTALETALHGMLDGLERPSRTPGRRRP